MNTRLVSLVVGAALAAAAATSVVAAAEPGAATLKPRQGISLDLGAKRAVGYFLSDARICNLTLLVADRLEDGKETIPGVATRLQFDVAAGADVKVDTGTGTALAFACATDAASMTVASLRQVAGYAKSAR